MQFPCDIWLRIKCIPRGCCGPKLYITFYNIQIIQFNISNSLCTDDIWLKSVSDV